LNAATTEHQPHTSLGDESGCIVVSSVSLIAALADQLGLANPVVFVMVE
jgi:hypothetical protein